MIVKRVISPIVLLITVRICFCQSVGTSGQSIEDFIEVISVKYGVLFSYPGSLFITYRRDSFDTNGMNLEEVLDEIVRGESISYTLSGKRVVFKKKQERKVLLKGTIKDLHNEEPLAYATVEIKGKLIGAIADYRGNFELEIGPAYQNDTLVFSSLGFRKEVRLIQDLAGTSDYQVYLEPKIYELPALEVESSVYTSISVGRKSKKAKGELYMDTNGQQTALYIENAGSRAGKIEKVGYYLSAKGNTNAPFRVRLYKVDSISGGPGDDLLTSFLVVSPKISGGWCMVDLMEFDIDLPANGFFVAMEGVFPNDYDFKGPGKPGRRKKNRTLQLVSYGQKLGFRRGSRNKTWHYALSETWFQLEKQKFNVMISADLLIENNDEP